MDSADGLIAFTDNFSDLSNQDGYQFEFRCERCGNGHRSPFQRDKVATGGQRYGRRPCVRWCSG